MRGKIRTTVYNSRNPRMTSYSTRSWILSLALLITSCCANGQTPNWHEPEQQLAGKISAVIGPGAISVDFANHSSLSRSQSEEIHRALLQELSILGLRTVSEDAAAATVQITLSENLSDDVWVANILQGKNEPAVVMVSFPRTAVSGSARPASTVTLHKTLLWSQPDRILDAALINSNPQNLLILDANGVSIYQMQSGHWQMVQALPIAHARPWPRDLRGRLMLRKDHLFDAYLPGVFCKSANGASLALNCRPSDDPWPLGSGDSNQYAFFAPTRNFFTGALTPGVGKQTSAPAFFSAAPLQRDRYTLWLFAATDGSLHLLDGFTDQSAQADWGSDIATVHSSCGSGWQVLTTSKNSADNDTIRIFEIPDREPSLVGQPSEFHGNITALWTQSDGNSAVAILQNSGNGAYEAYQITLACD
jgi:hypothetical protein